MQPPENILISVCTVCGEEHVVPGISPDVEGEYSCDGVRVRYGRNWTDTRFEAGRTYHPKRVPGHCHPPRETTLPLTNNFKAPKPEPEENILIPLCTVCGEEHVVSGDYPGPRGEYSCDGVSVKYGRYWTDTRFEAGRIYYSRHSAGYSYPRKTTRPLTNNFKPSKPEEKPVMTKVDALLSPDAPTTVNEQGGKQSETGVRLDLIPPKALFRVGAILKAGAAKYGELNWHKIPVDSHINHALVHLYAHLAGDTQDDHLGHATCRLQMALERHLMDLEQEDASEIPF